jgi:hypothetical protein
VKYIFLTFCGYSFPIAHRLQSAGADVIVGHVQNSEELNVEGWQGRKEHPEERKRRLSIYDGLLDREDANKVLRRMQFIADQGRQKDYFVVIDHNNLGPTYGEKVARMGFTGLVPNTDDYKREKDREAAHKFVEANYEQISTLPSESLKKVRDGIAMVEDSEDLWVLKSNGNLGETVVPKGTDVELNHAQIIAALETDATNYEAGGFLLEQKIANPIEFTPQLAFWNGEPIYSQVEIECKPIGAGDVGMDGGGAINLIVRTTLDSKLNELAFPKAVYQLAHKRPGLFLFDAGLLFDPTTEEYFFTEFAGNRWSWNGAFSEMAMGDGPAGYFEAVSNGENPLRHEYGATVTTYNILSDSEFPGLHSQDIPVYVKDAARDRINLYQVRQHGDSLVNVGTGDAQLGSVSSAGESMEEAASLAYKGVAGLAFKELLYRARSDYLSWDYDSAIMNRLAFLRDRFSML